MLVVAPPRAGDVGGRACGEIRGEHAGEYVAVGETLRFQVTGQREHAGRAAASPAVVPEAGPQPSRQPGAGDGVPAPAYQTGPGRITGDLAEQPEYLRVAGRPVAPAVAVPLDTVRQVLRIRMRHQEPVRSVLVACHHVRRACECQLGEVGAAGFMPDSGQCVDDAQRAVRDVVQPGRGTGPDFPVHAGRRRFGRGQVRLQREDGQLEVTGPCRAQGYAGVAAEQLEPVAPPLAVEPGPDDVQRAGRRRVRRTVTQLVAGRPQREGQASQAEIQRRRQIRPVHRGGDRGQAPARGVRVPVVTEMPVPLQQGQHDSRRAAVQRGIKLIVVRPAGPRERAIILNRLSQQPLQRVPSQRLRARSTHNRSIPRPGTATPTPPGRPG